MEGFGKLRIVRIDDFIERRFGKVYKTEMIKANLVTDLFGTEAACFYPDICEETMTFLVPESMLNNMVTLAQSNDLWEPNKEDFIKQTYVDNGEIITLFRHKQCYGSEPFLDYRVTGVTFKEDGSNVCDIPEEHWTFEGRGVITPHGDICFNTIIFIENYAYSGVMFGISESLRFDEIEYNGQKNINKRPSILRLMRRQNGKIIWFSMFDHNNLRIASFRGYDDVDYGRPDYYNVLKSGLYKYLDDLFYMIKREKQNPKENIGDDLPF